MKLGWKNRITNKKEQIKKNESLSNNGAIFHSTEENENCIKEYFHHTNDLIIEKISIQNHAGSVIYIKSLIDLDKLQEKVLTPISFINKEELDTLMDFKRLQTLEECFSSILQGFALLFPAGQTMAYGIQIAQSNNRAITEPETEKVLKGAHEGFVEDLSVNLNLIRKNIKSPNLVVRYVGIDAKITPEMCIVYMKNLANEEIVQEVKKRASTIHADSIPIDGYIEELMEDNTYSLFPQLLNTERPDRVSSNLLEGRIALLANGSTTAYIFPVSFFAFYQSPDDYNFRWMAGSFIRLIRMVSFFTAILFPAIYIAIVGFHLEVLPEAFVIPIYHSIAYIPYSPLMEAMILEITIELIREAAVRLPTTIGQTIGIVGGLVIGDAIVKIGLVSNTMIIVVAITAISAYVIPSNEMSMAVRLIRFPMMVAASFLGFVGIIYGLMILLIHLIKLESFGRAYMAPLTPFNFNDLKDTIIRIPLFYMGKRPKGAHSKDLKQFSEGKEWKRK